MLEAVEVGIGEAIQMPICCGGQAFTYVLAAGTRIKIRSPWFEATLHKICQPFRLHGEWFTRDAWELIGHLFLSHRLCASCVYKANGDTLGKPRVHA